MNTLTPIDPKLERTLMARWRGVMSGNRKAVVNVSWPGVFPCRGQRHMLDDEEVHYQVKLEVYEHDRQAAEHGFDNIPAVRPDFGIAYLLAHAFGCKLETLDDGKVAGRARYETLADAASFVPPSRPEEEGLYPEIRRRMREFRRRYGEVRMLSPDIQSPIDVITSLVKTEEVMVGFQEDPELIHRLLTCATEAIIRIQGVIASETPCFGGHGAGYCRSLGIHLSDDDASFLSPSIYREFCIPQMNRLSAAFGGVSLHCCMGYPQNVATMAGIDHFIACDPQVDFNPVDATIHALEGKCWFLYNHAWQRKEERKAVFPDMEMLKDSIDRAAGRVGLVVDLFGNDRDDAFRIGDEVREYLVKKGMLE